MAAAAADPGEMRRVVEARQTARAGAGSALFKDLPEKLNLPKMEEETQAHWKATNAFKTSLAKSEGRPRWSFYDGPPFATGLPHYGHLLAGTIKDVVCRYAHQTGHYVERRFGWDCHGLPIEFEIEKELGIKSSHDVKKIGIAKYNEHCRGIVMRYAKEWEEIVGRSGRWIDFQNDYKTMNLPFMESVWWVFKQLWEKKLVYRDFRVMPYSTGCTTPLSNFEVGQNYKDVSDPSCMVTFPLVDDEATHMVAWTTTPWTLPSNLALCVNADFVYMKVRDAKTGLNYVFAECRLDDVYANHAAAPQPPFTLIEKMHGRDLVGRQYVPLFAYFEAKRATGAFRVIAGDFVKSDAGTGVVHCAPGFGEEDFNVCKKHGIFQRGDVVCPIDENGLFNSQVSDYAGRHVKDCDNDILAAIKTKGRLLSKGSIVHSYPFCWRSETPLIYRAIEAWFVNVESFREQLLETNKESRWVPEFVQTKRFSNWLEDARDWNVSRNRYWGTPLPIWHSEDWEEVVCVGSVGELEELSGATGIRDIHREYVDGITIPSKRAGHPPLKRVEQVFDCWFESGSMPYGQMHYPFENKEAFEASFPADFIAEGLDQTRGWFYTLLVLSTALFGTTPYKNLIVNGLVLASDGKKMSKRLKNYPEASHILNSYGADALRLYLINSPVVRAESLKFREEGVKEVARDVLIPLANACKFFTANANQFLIKTGKAQISATQRSANLMDRWIVAAAESLVQFVRREMEAYRLYTVVPAVLKFVDTLTNCYVRMNRRRLKGAEGDDADWEAALSTLFQVMYTATRIVAPFTPFLAEEMYQCLRPQIPDAEESIHYVMVPSVDTTRFDAHLERAMGRLVAVIDLVRVMRDREGIPIKMPVKKVIVAINDAGFLGDLEGLAHYIKHEINAVEVELTANEDAYVATRLEANVPELKKRFTREIKDIVTAAKAAGSAQAKEVARNGGGVVGAHALTAAELRIVRETIPVENFASNSDGNVVVLMDKRKDAALRDSWCAREFVTRVQQLRKAAGLVLGDVVDIYFQTPDADLAGALERSREQIAETIRTGSWAHAPVAEGAAVIIRIDTEIGDNALALTLVRRAA